MSCAIAILARIQAWALDHKFPGSAALVRALDRVMGRLEQCNEQLRQIRKLGESE